MLASSVTMVFFILAVNRLFWGGRSGWLNALSYPGNCLLSWLVEVGNQNGGGNGRRESLFMGWRGFPRDWWMKVWGVPYKFLR